MYSTMRNQKLSTLVNTTAQAHNFSGVVSITKGDESLFQEAYGFADRSNGIANQVNTRFGTASGTKFFTALGIGRLIDSGEFSLDSHLSELVSCEFPNFDPNISVQQLLTHTSGVFDYYDEEIVEDFDHFYVDIPWYRLTTPSDYLPLFQNEAMKFNPGERFSYSNSGYILLGIIIEEISHFLYRDFIQEEVFQACGMTDSGFFALNQLPGRTALGYIDDEDGTWKTNVYNLPIIGASDGGAYTTAADMNCLWHTFVNGRLLSPRLTSAFQEPHFWVIKEQISYGLGLYLWNKFSTPALFIAGSDAGVGFDSLYWPDHDLTITILANKTDGEVMIRDAIYDHLDESDIL